MCFIKNKIKIPVNEKDIYKITLDLVKNGGGIDHPDSLIDWIIASNLYNGKRKIRRYTRGEIDILNNKELTKLAESLEIFEGNNVKQSIINVLKYLKKLDSTIVHPDIDLYIFQTLDEQRILSGTYDDIIKIFRRNKTLRKFIFDSLLRIIWNNLRDKMIVKYDTKILSEKAIEDLVKFIAALLEMKEIILVQEILRLVIYLPMGDDATDFIYELHFTIVDSNDAQLIEYYFKLLPYIRDLFEEALSDGIIIDLFEENFAYGSVKEYRDFVVPFFTAAMRAKNRAIIDYFINVWSEDNREYENYLEDRWFLDEIDKLVEEAKLIEY